MKQKEKEKWIDQTLNSVEGIRRAPAPGDLLEKSMNRSRVGAAIRVQMPARQWLGAAACGLILIVANLMLCLDFAHGSRSVRNAQEGFAKEYFKFSEGLKL